MRHELCNEAVGNRLVKDDPLGRHADLTLVHKGAECGGLHRLVDVGIVQNDQRRLAAKLQQAALQVARRLLSDLATDTRRAGEIDPPHGGMLDQRMNDPLGLGRCVKNDIQNTGGKPRLLQDLADEAMGARAEFRTFQQNRIPAGQRHGNRPNTQDDRCIPRRDAETNAHRLPIGQRERSRP